MMKWIRRRQRSPWFPRGVALLICMAVFGAVVFIQSKRLLQPLELRLYDHMLRQVVQESPDEPSKRVAVIGVTEEDLRDRRVQYPVSDVQMTKLLRFLLPAEGGARAVGVDIFRDIPSPDAKSELPLTRQREELVALLRDPRVTSVMEVSADGTHIAVRPPAEVSDVQTGYADFATDPDDVVRRALLYTRLQSPVPGGPLGKSINSISFRVARRFLLPDVKPSTTAPVSGRTKDALQLGQDALIFPFESNDGAYANADDRGDQMFLDFRSFQRIPVYSIGDVLEGKVPLDAFDGRAVFIGMTAQSVKDILHTPVKTKVDGVMVHALTADQLLRIVLDRHPHIRFWADRNEFLLALAMTLAGGTLGLLIRGPWRLTFALATLVAVICWAIYLAFANGLWLPVLPSVIGCVFAAGFVMLYMGHHERAERTVLNELFKRMVDEDVAETLWSRRDELLDHGQLAAKEVRATLLFTDLEGFTTLTEAMDKPALMAFLNEYMTAMSECVREKPGAFVNKYIGDAVMAVFGPPLERSAEEARVDAQNAVDAALKMREKLAANRDRWENACAEGVRRKLGADSAPASVTLRMRIGIQSGFVTAGSLGSKQRLEYTVIGDTVNTAARLESYDKDVMPEDLAASGCRILLGQDTLDLLTPGEYRTREVGSIQLKGKEQLVTIHGVIGRRDQ